PAPLKTRFSFCLIAGLAMAAGASAQGTGAPPTPANFVTSYVLQPSGNQVAIGNGGTMAFPLLNLTSTSTASFIIFTSGGTAGVVNSITVSGVGYSLSGLPLFPANLQPGSELRFTITFAPATRGVATGGLVLTLGGSRLSVTLTGQGVGAAITYTAT